MMTKRKSIYLITRPRDGDEDVQEVEAYSKEQALYIAGACDHEIISIEETVHKCGHADEALFGHLFTADELRG